MKIAVVKSFHAKQVLRTKEAVAALDTLLLYNASLSGFAMP